MASDKVICLWSGGKDSCFSYYKALEKGYSIGYLLNFISDDNKHSLSHNLSAQTLNTQMQAINIPFIQKEVKDKSYADSFSEVVSLVKKEGVKGIVFGDIYLRPHREWIEKFCRDNDINPIFPLWEIPTDKIVREFVSHGFKTTIVDVRKNIMDKTWLGRIIDHTFIDALKEIDPSIDPCGEKGEFHTFVTDGPIFKRKINIIETAISENNTYHTLDILKIEDVKKDT